MHSSSYSKVALGIPLALALGLVLAFTGSPRVKADDSGHVIEITAKRFAFTPASITLKKGERVTLRLHSEDMTHGFFMRALKIDEVIEPGPTKDVVLTPQAAGTFTTICDHFCGVNHGNMNMTIVVE